MFRRMSFFKDWHVVTFCVMIILIVGAKIVNKKTATQNETPQIMER